MKEKIDVYDYSEHIMKMMPRGILLNTNGDKFNSIVIGGGSLGTMWNLPTFAVYIREGRYTKPQLDKTGEFTVSIPLDKPTAKITRVCGALSGRDVDKAKEAGLTLAEPEVIHTPGVAEYPLTLECRVIYAQKLELPLLPEDIRTKMYPQDVDSTAPMENRDPHTFYVGEIVAAYILR